MGVQGNTIGLPFTNLPTLYESRIALVTQYELKREQFLLHLRSGDLNCNDVSEKVVNKDRWKRTILFSLKLVQQLMSNFGNVLIVDLPKALSPSRVVDHRIELLPAAQPPSKARY